LRISFIAVYYTLRFRESISWRFAHRTTYIYYEIYDFLSSINKNEDNEADELFEDAVKIVTQYDRASASLIQRRLSVGYACAARIIDQLVAAGVNGPANGSQPNDVLIHSYGEYLEKAGEVPEENVKEVMEAVKQARSTSSVV
jgi:DNA segregation ATPase FtsK/SpoIIIE-like protein